MNFTNLSCSLELLDATISAATSPALLEPFSETVATGTHAGICKSERTESQTSIECEDLIGTPITGSGLKDATIPGR